MNENHEKFIKRCYELAISAGKKGFDTFGAVLVSDGKIIAEAENTSDYEKGLFGHAELIWFTNVQINFQMQLLKMQFFIQVALLAFDV